jgi:hypothetical protein
VAGVTDYGKASVQVYCNERRDLTTTRTYQGNFATAVKALVAPITDLLRYTRKEDYDDAPFREFGNVGPGGVVQPKMTVYDANDVARTTIKETNLSEAEAVNMRTGTALRLTVYDPEDVARTARKETTLRDGTWDGTLSFPVARGAAVDPDDVQRPTGRETMDEPDTVRNPGATRAAGVAYDPEDWAPSTTQKQVLTDAGKGDYSDGNVYQGGRGGGYATAEYNAHATQKQYTSDAGVQYGMAALGEAGGYEVAPLDMRDVQRAALADTDYYGASGPGSSAAQMSYTDALAMRNEGVREVVEEGREPTASSVKLAAGAEASGRAARMTSQGLQTGDIDFVGRIAPLPTDAWTLGDVTRANVDDDERIDDRLAFEALNNNAQRADNPLSMNWF